MDLGVGPFEATHVIVWTYSNMPTQQHKYNKNSGAKDASFSESLGCLGVWMHSTQACECLGAVCVLVVVVLGSAVR